MSGSKQFLLDSSVLVRVLRGDSLLAAQVVRLPQVFVVPTIVGELYYGAHKSDNFAQELLSVKAGRYLTQICGLPQPRSSTN